MNRQIYEIELSLKSLTVYRGLLEDQVISVLCSILHDLVNDKANFSQFINDYSEFYYQLVEHNQALMFKDYLIEKIVFEDTSFSRQSERFCVDNLEENFPKAVARDLLYLQKFSDISAKDIKEAAIHRFGQLKFEYELIKSLPEWEENKEQTIKEKFGSHTEASEILHALKSSNNWREWVLPLVDFYRHNGSGEFAKYKGFTWETKGANGILQGIHSPDPIRFSDLIGYERQRREISDNTEQLLNGYAANNVLLYGDRGTGKSSTVKALLNEYGHRGLRIIELPKTNLEDLPHVLRMIRERQQKFIIFIDDLAFGDSEEEYTALKAVLEGSLESKPQNVVIYATSNRRHLIKEKFSDRSGLSSGNEDDEVRSADTMQEKLSLADRFGITVTYTSPDKEEYLAIVEGLARNRNLAIDIVTLHEEALKWEINHNGRSPRTARQFIDWLEAQVERK